MEPILEIWNLLTDKGKHVVVGLVGGLITMNINLYAGLIFMVLLLAGKEIIWDGILDKGTPEWADFFYGLIPVLLIYLIKLIC